MAAAASSAPADVGASTKASASQRATALRAAVAAAAAASPLRTGQGQARPCSAPALLRGDLDGLVARGPHTDVFLQRVEDSAVRRSLVNFRQEGHSSRLKVSDVDQLSDPSLFDLRVLHNGCQRARGRRRQGARSSSVSSMAESSRQTPQSRSVSERASNRRVAPTGAQQICKLRKQLEDDMISTCTTFGCWDEVGLRRPTRKKLFLSLASPTPTLTIFRNKDIGPDSPKSFAGEDSDEPLSPKRSDQASPTRRYTRQLKRVLLDA